MQVQDIINATSNDVRQVLSSVTDTSVIIPWVDRVQKDALHTSLYNYLLQNVATINVVQGTSSYTVTTSPNTIRRILLVYDRTFDRVLLPIDNVDFPAAKADAVANQQTSPNPMPMLTATTMQQWPEYYRRENGTGQNIIIFPAPQKSAFNGTYEVHYEANAPDLANTTDALTLPNDAKDMVVAGVNALACAYLHLDNETQFWTTLYEQMKKGTFIQ